MATYTRRQLLLRKEDDTPGGFVRMERVGERCNVVFNANGLAGEARAVLIRPGESGVQTLGILEKPSTSFTISAEEAERSTQAAVVFGDKVLMVGGEGADFTAIRRRLTRAKKVPRAETQASVRLETEMTAETREGAGEREPPERSLDLEPATAPALEPASGWEVTPFYTPGAPEQIEGHYRQDGKIVARLYGVAGVYAPEPPPGLQGFVWDNGYWVYVQRQETDP